MKLKPPIDFKINRLVKYFILSDLFLLAGWGLVTPIFAIFIVDKIEGATVITVGLAAAEYWILKALVQLPVANYLDKTEGERDEYYILVGGLMLAAFTAILFVFINKIWQLYALQMLHAIAFAMYTPAWNGIFARHIDKNRYAFEWTLDGTVIGLANGFTGAASGFLVSQFGFNMIFWGASFFSFVAAAIIFFVPDIVFPQKTSTVPLILDHRPQHFGH